MPSLYNPTTLAPAVTLDELYRQQQAALASSNQHKQEDDNVTVISAAQALLSFTPTDGNNSTNNAARSRANSTVSRAMTPPPPSFVSTTTRQPRYQATTSCISSLPSQQPLTSPLQSSRIVDVLPGSLVSPSDTSNECSSGDDSRSELTSDDHQHQHHRHNSSSQQLQQQHYRRPAYHQSNPSFTSFSSLPEVSHNNNHINTPTSASATNNNNSLPFYEGSTVLALDTDDEALSPIHCFMRRHCVEAFTASVQDVRAGKNNSTSITHGQVGIRCLHCKHRPPSQRQERAVCFPSSLKNIYHSIETWQRRHSIVCQDIPMWVKKDMMRLVQESRSGAGGRRQYWEESAKQLGIVETINGLRFITPPGEHLVLLPQEKPSSNGNNNNNNNNTVSNNNSNRSLHHSSSSSISLASCFSRRDTSPSVPVVHPQDGALVTKFLYLLTSQMERCYFTEQDRSGGRSKVKDCPVGYPGMQCQHCRGKAGFGRYFPTTLSALTSANSDRNIYNHLLKCRKCPDHVKQELKERHDQEQTLKNRRGARKMFFSRIWDRLHKEENNNTINNNNNSSSTITDFGSHAGTMISPDSSFDHGNTDHHHRHPLTYNNSMNNNNNNHHQTLGYHEGTNHKMLSYADSANNKSIDMMMEV